MKNFKKWPILVSLPNWPYLGVASTFGVAVCARIFSDDCTLSAYTIEDDEICVDVS